MTSKTFISLLAITPRKRIAATTIVYGLSLAVRFTSATGEELEVPAQLTTNPVMPIVSNDSGQLPYADWGPSAAQLVIFRQRRPLRVSSSTSCPSP